MTSIRHSLDELDQRDEREQLLLERQGLVLNGYASAIQSAREYALEIDRDLAVTFRARLTELEGDLKRASRPQEYQALQSSLRGEMRVYHDSGQALVIRLRNEVADAAATMQALTAAVAAHGEDYQTELKQELGILEAAAAMDDLPAVQSTIRKATASIQRSFEQMQRSNQLLIAQLQDEIRGLHKAMETERRAQHIDRAMGIWNRCKLSERIDHLLKQDESFALLLIAIANWRQLVREHTPEAADQVLKSLVVRLTEKFGAEGIVGRWNDDLLAVIVETDPVVAATLAEGTDRELSSAGAAGSAGQPGEPGPVLKIRSALIGRARGTSAADFYPRVGQQVSILADRRVG
jgi:GGDEF domain-containing protein